MKLGIYCGLANNLYLFAQALARQGREVCFIRDRADRFPMSQPVWEDIGFRMDYFDVLRAAAWPWSEWTRFEKQLNWTAPAWLYDPLSEPAASATVARPRGHGFFDTLVLKHYARARHHAQVLRKMQSCDALLVSGVEGSVLANASGRPYVLYPYGGDLMIAAGLLRPKLYHARRRLVRALVTRQLSAAYANAVCIASHEPTALATDFRGAESFLRKHKVVRVPLPFSLRKRGDKAARREQMGRLLGDLGLPLPEREHLGLVPSRIDYEWKGQDRLLRALARLNRDRKAANIHLIFSGWGQDFEEARQFARDQGIDGQITFLSCALSKPLLYQFYSSADFVVDQFILGFCGTSALEAMACGAPLITWINKTVERPWGIPPVLNARTEEEIAVVLADVSGGRIDLERAGSKVQGWMERNCDPASSVASLLAAFGGR